METERLQEFTVVVDEGSLTKAAQRLHCTQSMLSKHVAALERELGCSLLERGAGGVRPTKEGVMLYGQAARILQSVKAVYDYLGKNTPAAAAAGGASVVGAGPQGEAAAEPTPQIMMSGSARGNMAQRYELTAQELECLACYLDGQSLDELAEHLQLTRDDAAQVLGSVYRKTKARGKERLTRLVQLL